MPELTHQQQLHDKATRGKTLTETEQIELAAWYAQQDAEESVLLTTSPTSSVEISQEQVNQALAELQEAAERIQVLTAQNETIGSNLDKLTPQEKASLLNDIKQGEADAAAGNYLTLDELKLKYAIIRT